MLESPIDGAAVLVADMGDKCFTGFDGHTGDAFAFGAEDIGVGKEWLVGGHAWRNNLLENYKLFIINCLF